jgi:glycerol-3-phosphate dehydrogenase (NAD(P)+)
MPPRPQLSLPTPGSRRAVVVGAGSFGTAVDRENKVYLPEVELPRELRIEPARAGLARADYVFLGVP